MKRVLTIAAITATLAAAWFLKPTLPPLCALKNITGIDCPGCGMTRSVMAAAHGHLAVAIRFHAFGPFVLAGMIVVLGAAILGRRIPWEHRGFTIGAAVLTVALFAYWIVRLATGTAP